VTNNERLLVEYDNCKVLVTDQKIESVRDIIPILEQVGRQGPGSGGAKVAGRRAVLGVGRPGPGRVACNKRGWGWVRMEELARTVAVSPAQALSKVAH
jgi:hypothetical protein